MRERERERERQREEQRERERERERERHCHQAICSSFNVIKKNRRPVTVREGGGIKRRVWGRSQRGTTGRSVVR